MHSYFLIPLLTSIGASLLAAAVVARDPNSRSSLFTAALLGSTGLWALFDFGAHLRPDPDQALAFLRLSSVSAQLIAPLSIHLLLAGRPELRGLLAPLILPAWITTVVCASLGLGTSEVIAGLSWTSWGWRVRFGSFTIVPAFLGIALFTIALFYLLRSSQHLVDLATSTSGRWIVGLVSASFVAILVTDIVLPVAQIPGPRLGALAVVAMGCMIWGISFRTDDYIPPPGTIAREVLNTLDDGVALISADGRIRAINQALANLWGRDADSLVDHDVHVLLEEPLERLQQGVVDQELVVRQAGGGAIPTLYSTSSLLDHEGLPLGFVLVFEDQREVLELRRRLVTASRLAAVGELAAGIAHEVNNPIAYIQANLHALHRNDTAILDLLAKELPSREVSDPLRDGPHLIGQSLQEIARVSSIVKEVRGFSHMGPDELQWNDVNSLLESAVRIAMPQLRRSAKLVRDYGELPLCYSAGQDLKQLFLGLLLSAARSLQGSGTVRIMTSLDGDEVVVRVEDDGHGFSAEQLERIFDPAGDAANRDPSDPDLSVPYQIAREHGGRIDVQSNIGSGTHVRVALSVAGEGARDGAASSASPEASLDLDGARDSGPGAVGEES